jgi:hypothetical protein
MVNVRRVLTWKYEDGDGNDDADVGPAWVADADCQSEEVNGGEWLTRGQARALAEQNGDDFFEDDGREEPSVTPAYAEAVKAINHKLRKLGVSRDELELSAGHDDVVLMGSWYERVNDKPLIPRDNLYGFRHHGSSMSLDEALAKIRRLVPEWHTETDTE